jgi:hypothetical protein
MYVAMRDGVFRTDNAGQSWTGAEGVTNAVAVAVNPKRPSEVYATTMEGRIFVSRDAGVTWDGRR